MRSAQDGSIPGWNRAPSRRLKEVEVVTVERMYKQGDERGEDRSSNRQDFKVGKEDTFRDLVMAFRKAEGVECEKIPVYIYTQDAKEIHLSFRVFEKVDPRHSTTIFLITVGFTYIPRRGPASQWSNIAALA